MPADFEDRTEAPTPRRRQEARAQGQVARSQDLAAAVTLLAGMLFLGWWGPRIWPRMIALVRSALEGEELRDLTSPMILASRLGWELVKLVWPCFLMVSVVVLAALWAQVGWNVTFKPLTPNLDRLNPVNGLTRLVSAHSAMNLLTSLGKLAMVSAVIYVTVAGQLGAILFAGSLSLENLIRGGAILIYRLGVAMGVVLLVLGLADYAYQRFRHERSLRMTKQEVRDELKSMDGDPMVKQRRRRLQLEIMRQRLKRAVPQADMVVTNPTHLAIALKYDAKTMPAPRVVAKGADEVAQMIRQIALACGIPVLERRALVRAMYDHVEIGDYIPEKFYQAVAEVLAYVYRITGRRLEPSRRAG